MVAIPGSHRDLSDVDVLRVAGGFMAGFSVLMTPLVLFVLPGYSIVAAFEVFALFILFIAGIVTLLVGQVMSWRKRRSGTS